MATREQHTCSPVSARPSVALLGPLPPPYGGYATYVKLLRESDLDRRFGYHMINDGHRSLGRGPRNAAALVYLLARDTMRFWRATRVPSVRLLHIVAQSNPRRLQIQARLFDWAGRVGWRRIYDIRAGTFIRFAESCSGGLRKCLDRLMRTSEAVTVEGKPYVEYIARRWGVKAVYMPNFIKWAETGGSHQADPGCDHPPLRVVYAGRMAREKGIVELAEAAAEIDEQIPLRLDYIGPAWGRAVEDVQHIVREHGLEGATRLLGGMPKQQLLEHLAEEQVFAMPTYHATEGHSNSLTEAMGLGLAIVTCDQGFIKDVLGEDCGLFVEQRSSTAIAEALRRLAGDPALRQKLGENARARARALFTDEIVIAKWASLYERLLADEEVGS